MTTADLPGPPPERLSIREEQLAATRRRILEACAELALRYGGLDDPTRFTFARVAELAGVSERTVYRAFPTKQALSASFLDESTLTRGEELPASAEDLGPFLRRVCAAWDEQFPSRPHTRSVAVEPVGTADDEQSGRRARDRAIRQAVWSALPDTMDESRRRAVAGVFRHLSSIRSVAQTAARFDVTLAQAGDAHAWALETLTVALQEGRTHERDHDGQ